MDAGNLFPKLKITAADYQKFGFFFVPWNSCNTLMIFFPMYSTGKKAQKIKSPDVDECNFPVYHLRK